VANRDPVEWWRKWRRRRPGALLRLGVLLVAAAAALLAAWYVTHQLDKARAALDEGRQALRQRRHADARAAFQRGLAVAEDLPFGGPVAGELAAALRQAERGEAAAELHALAERLRALPGADDLPRKDARTAERLCGSFWEGRARITARLRADLAPAVERQVRDDLLDLAVLWSVLRVAVAPAGEKEAAHREALRVLAEAEEAFGPSAVLYRERQLHAAALRLHDEARAAERRAAQTPPRTAWEHYALGCSYLRSGELPRAAEELEQAVDLEPHGLWANFSRGRCAYLRGRHEEAVRAYTACVALAPDRAVCFWNRALALEALGQSEEAARDLERARRLDPDLPRAGAEKGRGAG
jgi:tetratricopeptide (TPR) repeat protein